MQQASAADLRRSAAIRVGLAVGLAAALACLGIVAIWGPYDTSTDIVGFPAFDGFNVENYLNAYYLTIGFFPLAALAIFLVLTRLAPRLGLAPPPARGPLRPADPVPQPAPAADPAPAGIRWGRVAFVGVVLGLELGIAIDSIWLGLLLGAAGYALTTRLLAGLGSGPLREWPLEARVAALNALAAPLALAGLLAASEVTAVHVLGDGRAVHYHWLPAWIALPLAAALLVAVVVALRRAGPDGAGRIERRALLLIAAPAALFALSANLQGDAPGVYGDSANSDLFHSGEQLVASRLVSDGWLPWRDVVLTHGLLSDAFAPLVGHAVFGDSRWGNIAGLTVLLHPLYLVCFYFLCVYLFGRNWLFLVFTALLAFGSALGPELSLLPGENFRFLLWPLILLVLAATLTRRSAGWPVGLGLLAAGQAIVTPEAAPALLAVAVVLVAYEWYWRRPGTPARVAFGRSLRFGLAALGLAAAFAVFLAAEGALGDYLYISGALVEGHLLKGGIPPATFELPDPQFYFVALAPVAALLISFAYAVTTLRMRHVPRTEDWVMAAVAIFLLVYYPKFIARMDVVHLYQPYSIALPLLLYVAYRLAGAADEAIRRRAPGSFAARLSTHPTSLLLIALVLAFNPVHLYDRVADSPDRYRPEAAREPQIGKLGYQGQVDVAMYRDLRRVVDAYLPAGERLLDFTNEPALFFYVLGRDPSTRWFDAALTLSSETQEDQIRLLRNDPPKLIAFDSTINLGLSNWDGIPTAVRDYEVSRWILARYRPLLTTHFHTFYVRRGAPAPGPRGLGLEAAPVTRGVEFQTQRCNWGKAPNYLSGPGMPPAGASSVAAHTSGSRGGLTIAAPPNARWSDYRWLEIDSGSGGFGDSELLLSDVSGVSAGHEISFQTLPGSPHRYVVPVSSCAQWYGYGGAPLHLSADPAQDVAAVRLIR